MSLSPRTPTSVRMLDNRNVYRSPGQLTARPCSLVIPIMLFVSGLSPRKRPLSQASVRKGRIVVFRLFIPFLPKRKEKTEVY